MVFEDTGGYTLLLQIQEVLKKFEGRRAKPMKQHLELLIFSLWLNYSRSALKHVLFSRWSLWAKGEVLEAPCFGPVSAHHASPKLGQELSVFWGTYLHRRPLAQGGQVLPNAGFRFVCYTAINACETFAAVSALEVCSRLTVKHRNRISASL